jgi:uncharacterized protein (DUF305 family)
VKDPRPIGIGAAALLFVLVVVTLMLGATLQDQGMAGMNHPGMNMSKMDMTSQLAGLEGEAFEAGFMSMMIVHHRGAVEMAQWILERTENPELRAAAEAILAAQEPEIVQMTEWLETWYGRSVDETMAKAMQQEMDMMKDAMAADGDSDTAFLREMTAHHDSALDMAQLALTRATHDELRALARDIIVAQAEEIYAFQTQLADR